MDKRKLRLYKFLHDIGRINLDDIPEPYKSVCKDKRGDLDE